MKVVIKRPGELFRVIDVPNELKALQDLVGGYIECVTLYDDVIICNEEGRLLGLPINELGSMTFYGTILIAGVKGEEFTDCSPFLQELFA